MSDLQARLLEAHARDDKAALSELYALAAGTATDLNEVAFFLTQAYVFSLDAGLLSAPALRAQLIALGRESELHEA